MSVTHLPSIPRKKAVKNHLDENVSDFVKSVGQSQKALFWRLFLEIKYRKQEELEQELFRLMEEKGYGGSYRSR